MDAFGADLKFVALGASTFQEIGGGSLAGEEQDFAAREEAANVDGGLNAVHVGHDDVADDKVGANGFGAFHSAGSGVDSRGIEPVLVEDDGERVRDYSFVVYDQYLGFVVAIHLRLHLFDAALLLNAADFPNYSACPSHLRSEPASRRPLSSCAEVPPGTANQFGQPCLLI